MEKEIKNFIVISLGWDGMPIAYKLQDEGCNVIVGQVQSKKELGIEDDEEPEDKEKRLKQYDGMIEKIPARKVIDAAKKLENKDDYFVFFDQNNLYQYAQEMLDAGFKYGNFPLLQDHEFEKDREAAMQFVTESYQDIRIIPYEEFSNVESAISFLKGAKKVYVIQSKGDFVATMVPKTDDPAVEREQMINQLMKNKAEYEQGGIILKEKLAHPIEITPQIVFMDGKPVFTDLDIETKNLGDGENNGPQVGCGTNLVIRTDMEDRINKIAFPQAVMDMATARPGIFVWDISIYIMPDGMYFGEFCSNRFGYDSIFSEITMCGSACEFFNNIINGINPIEKRFGTSVRLFNMNKQEDREISWDRDDTKDVYLYEVYKKKDKMLSLGCCWDLGVVAGAGDKIEDAIEEAYESICCLSFKELYTKTKHDFYDSYPTSIMFRYAQTNHSLYEAPDLTIPNEKLEYETKMQSMSMRHQQEMNGLRGRIESILNEDEISN